MLITEKQCKCCGDWWPADLEFFAPRSDRADGFDSLCRACAHAQRTAWRHSRTPQAPQLVPARASDAIAPLLSGAQCLGGCAP